MWVASCSKGTNFQGSWARPWVTRLGGLPGQAAGGTSYLYVALVGCSYASLYVHTKRPLGLLGGYGAHLGSAVLARHVTGK